MILEELRAAGAFIADEPVKVRVTWKEHNFDVYVRRLAFGDVERMMQEDNTTVAMIAAAVLLGEERTPLTLDQAARLDVSLAGKLIEAVNEVNGAPKP